MFQAARLALVCAALLVGACHGPTGAPGGGSPAGGGGAGGEDTGGGGATGGGGGDGGGGGGGGGTELAGPSRGAIVSGARHLVGSSHSMDVQLGDAIDQRLIQGGGKTMEGAAPVKR
ncbi:MAG: hypothetical protein KC731_14680 [Myxococcales bacterium]|nr:hypothetical protein [Myxococcales bacterium]